MRWRHLKSEWWSAVRHMILLDWYAGCGYRSLELGRYRYFEIHRYSVSVSVTDPGRPKSHRDRLFAMRRTRLKFSERAFSVAVPRALNWLPTELKLVCSTPAFNLSLKTFLFQSPTSAAWAALQTERPSSQLSTTCSDIFGYRQWFYYADVVHKLIMRIMTNFLYIFILLGFIFFLAVLTIT